MTKYRSVGAFNFIFASLQISLPLILIFVTISGLAGLYSEFKAGAYRPCFVKTYLVLKLIIASGFTHLFLGIKIFSKAKDVARKYFKYGLGLVIVSCFFSLIYYHFLVWSTFIPIYNLAFRL